VTPPPALAQQHDSAVLCAPALPCPALLCVIQALASATASGNGQSAVAQTIAEAFSAGGGTASATAEAVAQAYGKNKGVSQALASALASANSDGGKTGAAASAVAEVRLWTDAASECSAAQACELSSAACIAWLPACLTAHYRQHCAFKHGP
jgi:hypothetical protein